jgi:5-methylcytosine-specific restriction endonuclease McrA
MITITCKKCGKEFDSYPSWNKKYCSRKCSDKGKLPVICVTCNKHFELQESLTRERNFCSPECFHISRKGYIPWNKGTHIQTNTGKTHYKKGDVRIVGNKFRVGKATSQKQKESVRKVGKTNPHWKGGETVGKENRKEYFLLKANQRRVQKLGNGGSHTLKEWKELKKKYNFSCLMCGKKEPDVTLSKDHVIPLHYGGTDSIENIQPLCRSCNSKKHIQNTDFRKLFDDSNL